MERVWMEERHAMKAELQAARQEWAAGSAEMGRTLAVSTVQKCPSCCSFCLPTLHEPDSCVRDRL